MVGNKTGLAKLTSKYIGKSYKQYPCMPLIFDFYKNFDIDFESSFEDLDLNNYQSYWEKNKKDFSKKLFKWMEIVGENIPIDEVKMYDLLAVCYDNDPEHIYIAICLEQNKILTSNLYQGVRISFIGKRNQVVKAVRII